MSISELIDIAILLNVSCAYLLDRKILPYQTNDICYIAGASGYWGKIGVRLSNRKDIIWKPVTEEIMQKTADAVAKYKKMEGHSFLITYMGEKTHDFSREDDSPHFC